MNLLPGGVKVFSLNGNLINEFSLLGKSTQTKLFIECHFWGSGVAVMTSESIVYVAEVDMDITFILFAFHL